MALSRSTALLLLLPCPAVIYLAASLEDVSASSQCLSSPEAVRQEYPGAWPSWTMHAPNHKGVRCWYPAMRENHARRLETASRETPSHETVSHETVSHPSAEAPARKNTAEQRRQVDSVVNEKTPPDTPLASTSEVNELGWSFRSRTAKVGPGTIFDEFATLQSSFDDRFAAAFEVSSVRQPSVIQRMMDPVGAIP